MCLIDLIQIHDSTTNLSHNLSIPFQIFFAWDRHTRSIPDTTNRLGFLFFLLRDLFAGGGGDDLEVVGVFRKLERENGVSGAEAA